MRILLIEDERKLSNAIAKGLREEAYSVEQAFDGLKGEEMGFMQEHDLIILDLMLPGMDGLTLCQNLRQQRIQTPILILSARGQVEDRVKGLNLGADDYLAKPFEFEELLARVRSLLRRHGPARSTRLTAGELVMDLETHRVTHHGEPVQLTQLEYRLLEYLLLHQNMVISRAQLAERVWDDPDIAPGTIDVYISYLRTKIDKAFGTSLIQTVRGTGYQLSVGQDGKP